MSRFKFSWWKMPCALVALGAVTLCLYAGSSWHLGFRLLPAVHGEQAALGSRFARSRTLQSKGLMRQPVALPRCRYQPIMMIL